MTTMKLNRVQTALLVAFVLVVLVAAAVKIFGGPGDRRVVAHFPRTVAIYPGTDVKVLGVSVGTVDSVEAGGTSVKVAMHYRGDVDVPADASAVIVAPSVVGDRYVQLTPAYVDGPRLPDGAVLGVENTATPVELDDVYSSLDNLMVALGPKGANKTGALSDLLDQTAANLDGQGASIRSTVTDFGKLTGSLDANKEKFFDSATQLAGLMETLAKNDDTVRTFTSSLASVSELLAGERDELAASMRNLATALGEVKTFVTDNKQVLGDDLASLNRLAKVAVKRRDELGQTLDNAPLALSNLYRAYNPQAGTLDTSANLDKLLPFALGNLPLTLCTALNNIDSSGTLCKALK